MSEAKKKEWSDIPVVGFKKLHPQVVLPYRGNQYAAGWDVQAFQLTQEGRDGKIIIPPKNVRAVPTGLLVAKVPKGYHLEVLSRSGLAKNAAVFVANAPGLVDPDYQGEILVLLYNGGIETYYVRHGDRVAQLVLRRSVTGVCAALDDIEHIEGGRGEAGFGSTGT